MRFPTILRRIYRIRFLTTAIVVLLTFLYFGPTNGPEVDDGNIVTSSSTEKLQELRDTQVISGTTNTAESSNHNGVLMTFASAEDIVYLRELVGSIHHLHTNSSFTPTLIVYGFGLHPHHVDEIRLWERVDYKDGIKDLFAGPRDIVNEISLSEKYMESKKLELLLIAFERESLLHDLIAYVSPQNYFKMDSWKSIFTDIRASGAYYGSIQQTRIKAKNTLVSFAHLDVIGFRTTGEQFKTLVTDTLKCLRRYQCDDTVQRHITQMDHFFSWGLHEPEGLERTNTESSSQFFCNIRLREDIVYAKFNENIGLLQRDQESSPISILAKKRIAILMPTLSHSSLSSWKEIAPLEYFLPSFFETVTQSESEMFSYILYIGFDEGDKFFDNESHLSEIRSYVNQLIPSHITLSVRYIRFPYSHGWVTFIWNGLFSMAYNDGCDYFFQVNDDLSLIGSGWSSKMVQKLEGMDGLGVVGPYDRRQYGRISTQAFVSRKHYEIFGTFFPIEIKDWFSDNWISLIYGSANTVVLRDFHIINHNDKGTRYNICSKPHYEEAVMAGKKTLIEWRDRMRK